MLTKDWGDLNNPDAVNYLGLRWKLTPGGMQADMQKYVDKLEPMAVPTEQAPIPAGMFSRRLLAHIRLPTSHLLPQLACAVSKTAQKPEDKWTVADVKETEQAGEQSGSVLTHSSVSAGESGKPWKR